MTVAMTTKIKIATIITRKAKKTTTINAAVTATTTTTTTTAKTTAIMIMMLTRITSKALSLMDEELMKMTLTIGKNRKQQHQHQHEHKHQHQNERHEWHLGQKQTSPLKYSLAFNLILLMILSCWHPDFIMALKDVSVTIPQAVKRGNNALLTCNYDMENDTLYSVKWYKGRREFYRFTPKENPAMKVFSTQPGLNVERNLSNQSHVVLTAVPLNISGKFTCEISVEAPSFQTAMVSGEMEVVELPVEQASVTGIQPRYRIGDLVDGNCSIKFSKPAANLTWTINGIVVPPHHIKTYQIEKYEENNLESVLSVIHFMVTTQHFVKGQMRLKCTATIFDIFKEEIESVIEEDRPRIMASGRSYDINNYPYDPHGHGEGGYEDHNESYLTYYSAADISSGAAALPTSLSSSTLSSPLKLLSPTVTVLFVIIILNVAIATAIAILYKFAENYFQQYVKQMYNKFDRLSIYSSKAAHQTTLTPFFINLSLWCCRYDHCYNSIYSNSKNNNTNNNNNIYNCRNHYNRIRNRSRNRNRNDDNHHNKMFNNNCPVQKEKILTTIIYNLLCHLIGTMLTNPKVFLWKFNHNNNIHSNRLNRLHEMLKNSIEIISKQDNITVRIEKVRERDEEIEMEKEYGNHLLWHAIYYVKRILSKTLKTELNKQLKYEQYKQQQQQQQLIYQQYMNSWSWSWSQCYMEAQNCGHRYKQSKYFALIASIEVLIVTLSIITRELTNQNTANASFDNLTTKFKSFIYPIDIKCQQMSQTYATKISSPIFLYYIVIATTAITTATTTTTASIITKVMPNALIIMSIVVKVDSMMTCKTPHIISAIFLFQIQFLFQFRIILLLLLFLLLLLLLLLLIISLLLLLRKELPFECVSNNIMSADQTLLMSTPTKTSTSTSKNTSTIATTNAPTNSYILLGDSAVIRQQQLQILFKNALTQITNVYNHLIFYIYNKNREQHYVMLKLKIDQTTTTIIITPIAIIIIIIIFTTKISEKNFVPTTHRLVNSSQSPQMVVSSNTELLTPKC